MTKNDIWPSSVDSLAASWLFISTATKSSCNTDNYVIKTKICVCLGITISLCQTQSTVVTSHQTKETASYGDKGGLDG